MSVLVLTLRVSTMCTLNDIAAQKFVRSRHAASQHILCTSWVSCASWFANACSAFSCAVLHKSVLAHSIWAVSRGSQMHEHPSLSGIMRLTLHLLKLLLDITQARSEGSEWQDKWQHAVKELADVKERAWSLLEEKDLQLQALKVPAMQHDSALRCSLQKLPCYALCCCCSVIRTRLVCYPVWFVYS